MMRAFLHAIALPNQFLFAAVLDLFLLRYLCGKGREGFPHVRPETNREAVNTVLATEIPEAWKLHLY